MAKEGHAQGEAPSMLPLESVPAPGLKFRERDPFQNPFSCFLLACRDLDLKRPIYQKTACYGHFGRSEFPWEVPKKLVF